MYEPPGKNGARPALARATFSRLDPNPAQERQPLTTPRAARACAMRAPLDDERPEGARAPESGQIAKQRGAARYRPGSGDAPRPKKGGAQRLGRCSEKQENHFEKT